MASELSFTVHEDPLRVTYPYIEDLSVPTRWLMDIQTKREIQNVVPWVSGVQLKNGESWYAYKEIDRPFYTPGDSVALHVVQLVAVIISKNPYSTTDQDYSPPVMRGILLDYHSEGTLEQALKATDGSNHPWRRWALQIADALYRLRPSNNTHMDVKPSNVVIDNQRNAVLLDISGIGGVTHEWLAPEILEILDPLSSPFEMR
ncbi:protein kinase [Histoplasma capsulatum var. duboisii H88]|uniref:Protein kinase n=1 Tax=Ajellomyces capsulatus (strain H88) TaxID=544711 RepID=F0UGB0_AJEC8|nr:protein kinase [Histoplasma capsulatum var. duboisii H88]